MSRTKQSPIEQRRAQIEKELEKLRLPKNQKVRKDFASDENFENWKKKQGEKFFELNEELIILDSPAEYNEIPLAVVAEELSVTLNEMLSIVYEELIETSFDGFYKAGDRITREELARAIEIGAKELVRISEQTIEEIFDDAIKDTQNRSIDAVEKGYERIQKFDYRVSLHYSIVCGIALHLLKREFDSLQRSFWFIDSFEPLELAAILDKLRKVIEVIKPSDHFRSSCL